ncbi:YbeD family protein [Legionella dresdenensis]|uniref:UPF0250 protein ACFORL_00695 n=1 Tax=Legionella dresdenensis TaxID=450200 RepID=A0ABV8CC10_9GAMM
MNDKTTYMEFPCNFPIKIIGIKTDTFVEDISALVRKYFPDTLNEAITFKDSDAGNYTSITATVLAHDQLTLDALYGELTKYPGIKMVL